MITLNNAVEGQRVKLPSNTTYPDTQDNPIWGGLFGNIAGTLTKQVSKIDPEYVFGVNWDNGTNNEYKENQLEPVSIIVSSLSRFANTPSFVVTPANTTPTLDIALAVEKILNEKFFIKDDSFSNFDVTKAVREAVNKKDFLILGKQIEDVDGVQTQRVSRDDVRDVLVKLMDANVGYQRVWNGDWHEYRKKLVSAPVPSQPAVVFTPTGVQSSIPSTNDNLKKVIVSYVTHRNGATLKAIQSRIKDNAPTVRQIADLAASAGLKVESKTPYYSSFVSK